MRKTTKDKKTDVILVYESNDPSFSMPDGVEEVPKKKDGDQSLKKLKQK